MCCIMCMLILLIALNVLLRNNGLIAFGKNSRNTTFDGQVFIECFVLL